MVFIVIKLGNSGKIYTICEAEEEMKNSAKAIDADEAFAKLDAKYYG